MTDDKALREKLSDLVTAQFAKHQPDDDPYNVLEVVALDLLARLDAAEARVKTLTAERDALIMDACIGAAIISAFRGEPVSDFEESFPDVMEAKMARAALKGGQP